MALQTGAAAPYSETPLFLDYIYILAENADFVNHIYAQIESEISQFLVDPAQIKSQKLKYAEKSIAFLAS